MNEELLEELLKTIMTGQIDKESNEAALQLVTIVQKVHTSATYIPLPYTPLPPPLDRIFLTPEQEQKVLERIIVTAQENLDNPATVSLLWIAGKAHSEYALPILSIFLLENYRELSNDILYQGVISLENCLGSDAFQQIRASRLQEIKNMYREIADFGEERCAEIAKRDLDGLESL